MATLRFLLFLLISSCTVSAHATPGRKDDGHYTKDGKHNDEYDHETFLGHEGQEEFNEMDNQERVLKLSKLVDKIDKNGDNNVSTSELTAWMKYISLKEPTAIIQKQWAHDFITVIDADGLVSWEDYRKLSFPGNYDDEKTLARIEKFRKRFVAADESKDGKLSSDEYVAFQYLDLFPRMHEVFVDELLVPLDLDKDGGISFEEFKKGEKNPRKDSKREFEARDLNKNGVLEKNEIKEWYFPTSYDTNENEAQHLIRKADSDKDNVLTRKEILDNYDVFVGSRATHWGKTLKRNVDEL